MLNLKEYILEEKNSHMEHMEDLVFNGGVDGTRRAIFFLRDLRDMLSGHTSDKITATVKWDGCVHEDSIILTDNGDMTIREIVERDDLWGGLGIMGKDLESPIPEDSFSLLIAGNMASGPKSWVEVTLEDGGTLKLTHDHKVHTDRGWVEANALLDGDNITELG